MKKSSRFLRHFVTWFGLSCMTSPLLAEQVDLGDWSVSVEEASYRDAIVTYRSFDADVVYFVKAHFTKNAYGKEVRDVMAHVGILMQDAPPKEGVSEKLYWSDVRDAYLVENGDHFVGKFILTGTDNRFGPFLKYPVIQYWITFMDGSQLVTDSYQVPVSRSETLSNSGSFQIHRNNWIDAFERISDASFTHADELRHIVLRPN